MHHYISILWNSQDADVTSAVKSLRAALISRARELSVAYDGPEAFVAYSDCQRASTDIVRLRRNSGVVVGTLFRQTADNYSIQMPIAVDEPETEAIVSSKGARLITNYWGAYFSVIYDEVRRASYVFSDPTGNVPCYHICQGGIHYFFSDMDTACELLPSSISVNRHFLTRWLILGDVATLGCALEGVEHLQPGERFTLSNGKLSRAQAWNPIDIANRPRFEKPKEAAEVLRETAQNVIGAWRSRYEHIALRLSGGLDSSIVAGCLASASPGAATEVSYLNYFMDPIAMESRDLLGLDKALQDKIRALTDHGDERYFARLVAQRWNVPLIEMKRVASVSLSKLWDSPLTINPSNCYLTIDVDDMEVEFSKKHGTQAFFCGDVGDCVFQATMQSLPAVDYAYLHGFKRGLWDHIIASTALSRESVWGVVHKVIRHGFLRRPSPSPVGILLGIPTLLKREAVKEIEEQGFIRHWDKMALALPPGKRNLLNGLSASRSYTYADNVSRYAHNVDPLNSQPIWELMLQIPTYTILTGGVSRGLARQAFAEMLPEEIRRRQLKGSAMPFYQQRARRNLELLRDTLLDGRLVREGYLDRQKLSDCLFCEEPFAKIEATQLLIYLAAEIWFQRWNGVRTTRAVA